MERKSPEDWKNIIQTQQASGLTAAEYCRQNNINQKYFSLRKGKLKNKPSAFISAKVTKAVPAGCSLSWSGMRLEFSNMPEIATIANLMKALNS